jgi:hypothetical protein
MRCNVCGRETKNDEANFCEYCGSSFREQRSNGGNPNPQEQNYQYNINRSPVMSQMPDEMTGTTNARESEKPVSFLNWLGTYGIFFIPCAGWLIFIVMLFIWAFAGNTPLSKRNWARATLIFTAVIIVFMIAYFAIVIAANPGILNGDFDYNSYFNNLNQ